MDVGLYHERAAHWHAGGIATFVREISIALSRRHNVYLYGGEGDVIDRLAESSVEVVQFRTPPRGDLIDRLLEVTTPLSGQLRSKLITFGGGLREGLVSHVEANVDVMLTHQWLDDLLLSNALEVPTVFEFHGVRSSGLGSTLRDRYSKTDDLLANSRHTADRVEDVLDRSVDGIVPPGVDPDLFRPGRASVDREEFTVLFVGRIARGKGVFDLVQAVSSVPEAHLYVVGSGDERPARALVRELGVAPRVTFTGDVPHSSLPGYYAGADAVCVPAHSESYGMVNLEAMACGRPVVAPRVGGVTEYATHGENCLLVEPGDVEAIADAMRELASSPTLRDRLGSHARETANAHTWSERAERLSRFCEDRLQSRALERRTSR